MPEQFKPVDDAAHARFSIQRLTGGPRQASHPQQHAWRLRQVRCLSLKL